MSQQHPFYQQGAPADLIGRLSVDVYAEFEPQRLPLAQIRQMSEGLLVDIGALSQNRVRLHVDGKTVAIGELVIVGDRYGVLITKIPLPGQETGFAETRGAASGAAGVSGVAGTPLLPTSHPTDSAHANAGAAEGPRSTMPAQSAPPAQDLYQDDLMDEVDRLIQG
ncbi:MAG: FliM/FliN family flagellar motor switch protein [Vampirovibrionales bacterium]|nr:FliM/FliN family flagellar motor switch protein [Vampirovibrionales bacterium]